MSTIQTMRYCGVEECDNCRKFKHEKAFIQFDLPNWMRE